MRFFRGDAEEPSKRTLRQQESEAQQLALALGDAGGSEGLMFRLAVETGQDGNVARVVFLALRGEAGAVECFWPVPMGDGAGAGAGALRPNSAPALQLPLASAAKGRRASARRGAGRNPSDAPD